MRGKCECHTVKSISKNLNLTKLGLLLFVEFCQNSKFSQIHVMLHNVVILMSQLYRLLVAMVFTLKLCKHFSGIVLCTLPSLHNVW